MCIRKFVQIAWEGFLISKPHSTTKKMQLADTLKNFKVGLRFNWHHSRSVTGHPGLYQSILKPKRSPAFCPMQAVLCRKILDFDTFQLSNRTTLHWSLSHQLHLVQFHRSRDAVHGKTMHQIGMITRLSLIVCFCCAAKTDGGSCPSPLSQRFRCKDCGLPESWMSCNQLDVWRSASYGLKPHPKSALATIKAWGPITSMYIHPIFCYFMMGNKY